MKIAFIVQGEGRGHLTQAMALRDILERNKHEVCSVLVGINDTNTLPQFFTTSFEKYRTFQSPSLRFNPKTNALNISKTIFQNLKKIGTYFRSLKTIRDEISTAEPQLIINFYEGLGGIYNFFLNTQDIPMIAVAHQYLLQHRSFKHPKKKWLHRFVVNLNSTITALGVEKKLALSFDEFEDDYRKHIYTVPPLLRKEVVRTSRKRENEDFVLAYVNQPNLARKLANWQSSHSDTTIHCFVPYVPDNINQENLYFHLLDGKKFLEYMSKCSGLVSTAGFESICEAMYFQKPVLLVPLENHYEQFCNALDAVRAGAGITQNNFNLTPFLAYIKSSKGTNDTFGNWVATAECVFLEEIEAFEEIYEYGSKKNSPPFKTAESFNVWLNKYS